MLVSLKRLTRIDVIFDIMLPFGLDPNRSSSDESSPNKLVDFDTVAGFVVLLWFFTDSLGRMGGGPNKLSSSSLMSSNKLDFGTVLVTLDPVGFVSVGTFITFVGCFDVADTFSGCFGLAIGGDSFLTLPPPKMSSVSNSSSSPNRLTCFVGNFGGDSLNGFRFAGISNKKSFFFVIW